MIWAVLAYAVMGIALAAFVGTGAYAVAVVVALMMLGPCGLRAYRAWTAKPSTMTCPNCGSGQVRITSRVEGMTGSSSSYFKRSILMPRHRVRIDRQGGSQINRQRIGLCQSCGFDFPYITVDEVTQERGAATRTAVIVLIVAVLCTVFGLFVK